MNSTNPRTTEEWLKIASGILLAGMGVAKAVRDFSIEIRGLTLLEGVAIGIALVTIGILVLRDGLRRRSRLLRPEDLVLRADNVGHLKGRDDDIRRLVSLSREFHQVNLIGETGAGKSALVVSGLVPLIRREGREIPIVVSAWGDHWIKGPFAAVTGALALWAEDSKRLPELKSCLDANQLVSAVRLLYEADRRRVLLVFDQFDDYQTRHQSSFISSRNTRITTPELCDANPFWKEIQSLVTSDLAHVLFVTTTQAAFGLESVRFSAPQTYRLGRLSTDFVRPLLTELTVEKEGRVVISYPNNGWDRLQEVLIRDLSMNDLVLPVQLKFSLQALPRLRALTPRHYEAVGRLPGLEASLVERHINSACQDADLSFQAVLAILLGIVNREQKKSATRTSQDIAEHVSVTPEAVDSVMAIFEQKELVRRTIDPENGKIFWGLAHDYLARGILEAERRTLRISDHREREDRSSVNA